MVRFHRTPLLRSFLTSTRIAQPDFTEHHSGASFCHGQLNLNKDCILHFHRTPIWRISLAWEGGPQQGLHDSISQNTTLVHFSVMGRSTSTRIAPFDFAEHRSCAIF